MSIKHQHCVRYNVFFQIDANLLELESFNFEIRVNLKKNKNKFVLEINILNSNSVIFYGAQNNNPENNLESSHLLTWLYLFKC